MSRHPVKDRRVWVTGASAGIGRAVAEELLRRKARVIASARTEEALKELAKLAEPDRVMVLPLNVTDRAATLRAMEAVRQRWGGLDIALFNAGTCEYVDVKQFDSTIFERTMRTNVLSMAYGVEAVLPLLRRSSSPHLVAMSSTVAYGGLPRAEAYGASKAAIKNMFEALRVDLASEGIPVSILCPGFVKTPLTDRNDFPMPFRIEADDAARRIVDGIEAQTPEIHFPKRFSIPLKLLTLLPSRIYTTLCSKMVRPS